jgi:hypothetical protein
LPGSPTSSACGFLVGSSRCQESSWMRHSRLRLVRPSQEAGSHIEDASK